jgi:hypothetical protein
MVRHVGFGSFGGSAAGDIACVTQITKRVKEARTHDFRGRFEFNSLGQFSA